MSKVRLFSCVLVCLVVCAARADAAPLTGSQMIEAINAQRAQHGLPTVVEEPAWSAACARHTEYIRLNGGGDGHSENPSKPGYSAEGAYAASNSILTSDLSWEAGPSPWEDAPYHLLQMLNPRMTRTGASQGCVNTLGAYDGAPAPAQPTIWVYPGEGTSSIAARIDASNELPSNPAKDVGLGSAVTGANLLAWASGPTRLTAVAGSLAGPEGSVEVRLVTREWMGGAVLVPAVGTLRANAQYRASVTYRSAGGDVTREWGFATAPKPNTVFVRASAQGADVAYRVTSDAPNPTVALTGPGGRTASGSGVSGRVKGLKAGAWRVCARSGGTGSEFAAAESCAQVAVRERPVMRLSAGKGRLVRLRVDAALVGRRASVSVWSMTRRCGTCKHRRSQRLSRRTMTLHGSQTVRLPKARKGRRFEVRATVEAFRRGDAAFLPTSVTRDFR